MNITWELCPVDSKRRSLWWSKSCWTVLFCCWAEAQSKPINSCL